MAAQPGQHVVAVLPDRVDDDQRRVDRDRLEHLDPVPLAVDETVALARVERVGAVHRPAEAVDRGFEGRLELLLCRPARDVRARPQVATGHCVHGGGGQRRPTGRRGKGVSGHRRSSWEWSDAVNVTGCAGAQPHRAGRERTVSGMVHDEPAERHLAAEQFDLRSGGGQTKLTPAGAGGERCAQVVLAEAGSERQRAGRCVVVGSGERDEHAPAGQRPGVVVAALGLVPRVAPVTVVPVADRPHEPQALLDETLVDEVAGHLVLDAGPHLVAVDERDARTAAPRPRAQHQPGLVAEGVRALHAVVVADRSVRKLCRNTAAIALRTCAAGST